MIDDESKKTRVAYFYTTFRNAAMARWVKNITENIDQSKYAVSFVGLKIEESFTNEIPKSVRVVDLSSLKIPTALFKLILYFKRERPDIFVSAFPHINVLTMVAKIISGVKTKVVLTDHNHFEGLVRNARSLPRRMFGMFILPPLMKVFYPLSDAVICCSQGVAESISQIVNLKDKLQVIYYHLASDKIREWAQEPVDHPWLQNSDIPVVLGVGRLLNQKDFPTLLRAFQLVIKTMPARLVILGDGVDKQKLEKLTKELGISEGVAFLGFQKNPFKYMKRAFVFVLSSLHEGFGNVLIEAMACGTPVISTNCKSGPAEIIENNKSGILVPVRDYKLLSEAIIRVLSDDSLRQKFSAEGLERAKFFSVQKNIRGYEKLFQELMIKI